jgi:hypothetical protein
MALASCAPPVLENRSLSTLKTGRFTLSIRPGASARSLVPVSCRPPGHRPAARTQIVHGLPLNQPRQGVADYGVVFMALLAEELVEEWLNRQGYFTIRGIKIGVHEIDILAMRPTDAGLEYRQLEVQASMRPVSYISRVPAAVQKAMRRSATSSKLRTDDELREGVREWIAKKFDHPQKLRIRSALAPGRSWTRELVVHVVRHEAELKVFAEEGIRLHRLGDIVRALKGRLLLEGQ